MNKKVFFILFFSIFFYFISIFINSSVSFAAAEFVSSIMQSGGDYNTLASWETAIDTDLTVSSTKVYSVSSTTGTVSDAATVTGSVSTTTKAKVLHNSTLNNQVLVQDLRKVITGTSTFSTSSNIVTGTGTLYTTELLVGDYVWLESSQTWNQIASIASSTELTLSVTSTIAGSGQSSVRGKSNFQSGEQLQVTSSTYIVISNTGDSAIATAKIDGAWTSAETSTVTIDGWTTSAANYIYVYTTTAARHNGKWDTGKYRLEVQDYINGIEVFEYDVRITGLQIYGKGYSARNGIYIEIYSATPIIISENIIKGPSDDNGRVGIKANYSSVKAYNNIIYGYDNLNAGGILIAASGASDVSYLYNNTIINMAGVGITQTAGVVVAKNNIVQSSTDGYSGTFATSSDYNISDIAGDAPNATFATTSKIVSFVSTSTADLHLASSDTAAKDSGVNLSADPNLSFTTDIDGQTRPYGSAWDIGADENYAPSNPSFLGPSTLVNGSWATSTQPSFTFTQSDANASNTQQYRIQISTSSSFASQVVDYTSALLAQTSTSFTVGQASSSGTYTVGTSSQTLSDGSYYWRVMSTDNLGATSSYTTANSGAIAFGVDTTAPAGTIASSTYGTITSSSIIINRPSTSTITESGSGLYQWQVRRNSTTTLSAISTSTATTSDSSLTSNTQYTYDVRFIDLAGNNSSYGATSSKYTLTPDPTNFSASAGQTSVTLSVDSFNNTSSASSSFYFLNTTNNNNSSWITINSWTDTGLTCNTSYSYTIKYRNGDAVESATSSLSQTISACSVSAAIANAGLPISILASAKPQLISTNIPISTNIHQYQPSQYPTISFTKYLYPGLSNPEVKTLQTLLSQYPDIYPEAIITGYFGSLTKQAVQKLQIKYNITDESDSAYGYVGPKTRKILNLLQQINYLQNQLNQILSQIKKSS